MVTTETLALSPAEKAQKLLADLHPVIDYMTATSEDSWRVDTVRSADGSTNCFFGHLFNMGSNDAEGSALWNWFEEMWATTYAIYPVNDGSHPGYPQPTPRQRILAYLRALQSGEEMTTHQSMDAQYEAIMAQEAAA